MPDPAAPSPPNLQDPVTLLLINGTTVEQAESFEELSDSFFMNHDFPLHPWVDPQNWLATPIFFQKFSIESKF